MVSFEFKTNDLRTGLGQVFHMSAGGKGAGRGSKYGDRTPAIWTHSSRGFLIASAVNGRYSYAKYLKPVPSLGEWTSIEVRQEVVEAKSVYSVTIGGRKVLSVTKTRNRPRLRTSKSSPPAVGTPHSHQGVPSSRTS